MSSDTLIFLKSILPNEGLRCVFILEGKRHFWFENFEEMAEFILQQDAQGKTVYHGCASFKVQSRKAKNAFGARSLWLDVDCGEGKPYPDSEAGYDAVRRFLAATHYPKPAFVGSGYGLHLYWPLVETLDSTAWLALAGGLRAACAQHSLDVDGSRTCDLASILRPVGSHNRKFGGSRLVKWSGPVGPYEVEQFENLKDVSVQSIIDKGQWLLSSLRPKAVAHSRLPKSSLIAAALNVYTDEPSDAEQIAEQCNQIRELRDSRGCVSEPHWYAALGVLARTVEGHGICHDWSSGYSKYSKAETEEKINHALEYGPTTCAHFQTFNAKDCEGCEWKGQITTPLQLGRASRQIRTNKNKTFEEIFSFKKVNGVALPDLPKGFVWHENGLHFETENKDGPIYIKISKYPLWLEGVQTREIDKAKFSLRFNLDLPKAGRKEIAVSAKDFFSSTGISTVCGEGAIIHEPDLFKQYVRDATDMWNEKNNLEQRYEQFGWKANFTAFLYGRTLYSAEGTAVVVGTPDVTQRSQWLVPRAGGTLAAWSHAADALFTVGCEAQSFSLLCSFAAPLMPFHTTSEGGAVVHLVSRATSTGKSTALDAVASVWGQRMGLELTRIDTKNSKAALLGVMGNLPVVYDEILTERDPEFVRDFVETFTNGRDKMRVTREGEIRQMQATWQTILFSAANKSLVDMLSSHDTDAQSWRVLEFDASLPEGLSKRGDELKRDLRANAGHVGHVYLQYLTQPSTIAWIKQALPKITEEIYAKAKLENKHRFWARTLASAALAGTIVKHLNLLNFSAERIVEWAIGSMRNRVLPTMPDWQLYAGLLNEYLNEFLDATLIMPHAWKQHDRPIVRQFPMRQLRIRYDQDTKKTTIMITHVKEWFEKRHRLSWRLVVNELYKYNIVLNKSGYAKLGAGTDLAAGQVGVIAVDGAHQAMSGHLKVIENIPPTSTLVPRSSPTSFPHVQEFPKDERGRP